MEKSERIASFMLKSLRKANRAYRLMVDGDHIAVAVSGGKDSQTLLRLLRMWQPFAPLRYSLCAIHIELDGIALGHQPEQREELESLFQSLEIPYAIRHVEIPADELVALDCFRCSRLRRKEILTTAHGLGCNKVALGHHADDIATTALLNLFFHGRFESMAPRMELFDGLITLIRPLALMEEKDIVTYARAAGFWKPEECCPLGEGSQRAYMHQLLRTIKRRVPRAQVNLYRAVEQASHWVDNGRAREYTSSG